MRLLLPLFIVLLTGCPKAKTETQTPTTKPTAAPEKKTLTIGPDECCCPFASAESIDFNISPKKDCEELSGCIEDAKCLE